jgi:hypothetical protein
MRVFLKTKSTQRYYRGFDQPAAELSEALEFASIPAAAKHALAEKLLDVEIALRCDYLDREILLPLLPVWCELDETQSLPAGKPAEPAPPALPGPGEWASWYRHAS